MLSLDDVSSLLQAVTLEGAPSFDIKPVTNFKGKFKEKVECRVEQWKKRPAPITFERLNYYACIEVGRFTGNQVARVFHDVVANEELSKEGNCVLFSIEEENVFALVFTKDGITEGLTPAPPREKEDYKYMFSKLFNEDSMKQQRQRNKTYSHCYSERKISQLRHEAKLLFPKFLKTPLREFPPLPYRCSFLGVLLEIAKNAFRRKYYAENDIHCQKIPIAACIKLALDTQESGKLRRLFGDHITDDPFPGRKTLTSLKGVMQERLPKNPSRDDKNKFFLEYKSEIALEVAKEIIKKAIPSTGGGMFREEDVEKVVNEIKDFYQIE